MVARLLLISGYNYETSVTLLATQGTATVIFGSLLGVTYVIPTACFLALAFVGLREQFETGTVETGVVVAYYVLGTLAVVTSPLVIAGAIAVAMAIITVEVVRAAREGHQGRAVPTPNDLLADSMRYTRYAAGRNILVLWAMVVGVQVLVTAPPWMPAERVEVDGETETRPIVGYILEDTDEEIVVLRDSPREVVRLSSAQGFTRTYCETHAEFWHMAGRPLIAFLSPEPQYPAC